MNVPSLAPTVNKRLSRSNSTSSSVSTVKYIGSKIGHRTSRSTTRPTSSDSINHHFSILDAAAEQSNTDSANDSTQPGRSPNRNINRWSQSTSSSMGAVEKDVLRQIPPNSIAARAAKFEAAAKSTLIPKSQYSVRQLGDPSAAGPSHRKSPGRRPRSSGRTSPEGSRIVEVTERLTPLAATPDPDSGVQRRPSNEYFGTTVLDHSRGANKFGQAVEGIALQFVSGHSRQRRSDQNKFGNGLHDAANSSHISVQAKSSNKRRRDRSANGSRDNAIGVSAQSLRGDPNKKISHRSPLQKNMLSQALAKANQAVELDNAQDIQGAIGAYVEACDILEQVMVRSADDEDRKKLSAIRNTYSSRIADLYDIDKSFEHLHTDKELPEAPATTHYLEGQDRVSFEDPEDFPPSIVVDTDEESQRSMYIPPRQESFFPELFGGDRYLEQQAPTSRHIVKPLESLKIPMDVQYMPPPLSPRRLPSSTQLAEQAAPAPSLHPDQARHLLQGRRLSSESTSWLDTVDDNNSPARSSSLDFGTLGNPLVSAIEAEFDAMSAAVDAAYQEDLRQDVTPRTSEANKYTGSAPEHPQAEQTHSFLTQASQHGIASEVQLENSTREYEAEAEDEDEDEDEEEDAAEAAEEEELLNMMMADGCRFDHQHQRAGTMSSLPRQSDSSGFSARSSGRTWESALTSVTNGTALSTLAESPEMPQYELPEVPNDADDTHGPGHDADFSSRKQPSPLPLAPVTEKPGLRDRRMSGQSAKQLKIETFARRPSLSQHGQPHQAPLLGVPPTQTQTQTQIQQSELTPSASGTNLSTNAFPMTPLASIHSTESTDSPDAPGLSSIRSNSTAVDEPTSELKGPTVRKKTSSSNLRPRNLSVTTSDLNDAPPTPGSAMFPGHSRQTTATITPAVSNASPSVLSSTAVGGLYIFDHFLDPVPSAGPRSPDSLPSEPLPLEPCPESFLLRPFWLMRCLYQTMAHPKGGYITTRLFVPRDIWRVKGVKIKGIEDKIAQCDVLTAALLKLAKVDTLDAEAVCEELQSFESITDNIRVQLQKKFGGDVGITASMTVMKASPAEDPDALAPRTSSSMKSFTNSLRKLRSKSSTVTLTPAVNLGIRKDSSNDATIPSLPMTSSSAVHTSRSYRSQRYPPPTPTGMPFITPLHANYMSSLARLFDAVQVLDSIARQVEDPGLKGTSQSHVGLELSIRGAADFFSFYIIRFVLADIGLLLDKYLKRNGEWAMT